MMSRFLGAVSIAAMCLTAPQALAADVLDISDDFEPTLTSPMMYASVFVGFVAPTKVTGQYYGSSTIDLDAGLGFVGGVAVGTQLLPNARIEGELSLAHQLVDDPDFMPQWNCAPGDCDAVGSISTTYLLGNIWWDFDLGGGFTPYVGAGAGVALVSPNIDLYDSPGPWNWNVPSLAPAAQLGAGVLIDVADNMKVDLGYRAKAVLGATFADSEFPCGQGGNGACAAVGVMYVQHILQAGLTLEF
jgi:opacity protein-like surface antigen